MNVSDFDCSFVEILKHFRVVIRVGIVLLNASSFFQGRFRSQMALYTNSFVKLMLPDVAKKPTPLSKSGNAHHSVYISISTPQAVMRFIVMVFILQFVETQQLIENVNINYIVCLSLSMVSQTLWESFSNQHKLI